MDAGVSHSSRRPWGRALMLFGAAYAVVGILFAGMAGWSESNQARTTWRLAAWGISAVAFAIHVAYEHYRLRSSALTTALHASMAVALGAFALALAANLRGYLVSSSAQWLL